MSFVLTAPLRKSRSWWSIEMRASPIGIPDDPLLQISMLAHDPTYRAAYLDRAQRLFGRSKNHACIVRAWGIHSVQRMAGIGEAMPFHIQKSQKSFDTISHEIGVHTLHWHLQIPH